MRLRLKGNPRVFIVTIGDEVVTADKSVEDFAREIADSIADRVEVVPLSEAAVYHEALDLSLKKLRAVDGFANVLPIDVKKAIVGFDERTLTGKRRAVVRHIRVLHVK